jgi:hypothetical protein
MEVAASIVLLGRIFSFLQTLGVLDWVMSLTALGVAARMIGMYVKMVRISQGGGKKNAYNRSRYYTSRHN